MQTIISMKRLVEVAEHLGYSEAEIRYYATLSKINHYFSDYHYYYPRHDISTTDPNVLSVLIAYLRAENAEDLARRFQTIMISK